jgi:hypothetical protein
MAERGLSKCELGRWSAAPSAPVSRAARAIRRRAA